MRKLEAYATSIDRQAELDETRSAANPVQLRSGKRAALRQAQGPERSRGRRPFYYYGKTATPVIRPLPIVNPVTCPLVAL